MKHAMPLLILFLFWFGILTVTGTLFSGYHFIDDHDVIRIDKDLSKTTLAREMRIFSADLLRSKLRFRPFYQLHRRMATAVLGANFTAWSVYFGLLAVFTTYFLALFLFKTGFSVMESTLFALLTLLGEQAAIWWKLGANETVGMFLLAAAMLCMAKSVYADTDWKEYLFDGLFVLFTILSSWSKESFILVIPALVAWKIWLIYREQEHKNILQAMRVNGITSIILLAVCAVELLHIIKNVGATGIQYAGYEGFNLTRFAGAFFQSVMAVHGWVVVILSALIAAAIVLARKHGKNPDAPPLSSLWWPVILAGMIAGPQIMLYMKSGIMERYLLPGVMGYAFLMVVLPRYLRLLDPPKKSLRVIAIAVLMLVCLQQLRVTRYTAIAFAQDGKHTNAWFNSIAAHTSETDKILAITDMEKFFEPSISFKTYLHLEMNRANSCFSPTALKLQGGGLWKDLNESYIAAHPGAGLRQAADLRTFKAVVIFPGLEAPFLEQNRHWFKPAGFKRYTNAGGFVSYYRL
jgi:hypothetical protein